MQFNYNLIINFNLIIIIKFHMNMCITQRQGLVGTGMQHARVNLKREVCKTERHAVVNSDHRKMTLSKSSPNAPSIKIGSVGRLAGA